MKTTQIHLRMSTKHKKQLKDQWKEYCVRNSKIPFNTYLAMFLKLDTKVIDPLSPKVPLGNAFVDDRGTIQNILNANINAVALIRSKAGSTRSNHWHATDWHYLYVIEGYMKYSERTLDKSYVKTFFVKEGEMVWTAPGLVHKTEFLDDTLLLSMNNYVDHDGDTTKEQF